ncbi:MAG: MFS transporter [Bacteroidia bacterium]|nr:MFS transporter [Bacteroidia bacterium]MBT8309273.1 MFS transporter [Bacteroidia bacterium]NND12262.1 MFS transporter [Flavobacteriaceae bacterium]NNK27421.1 MFS transporter [Flavobacteriaceae bacterium]NNL61076.1 MFS transporter [Flavobacteriaceae bacterium]
MKSLWLILNRSRYFAPALVFATINVLYGTWAIYIPSIKDKLNIDEAELGIAIFCMALGTLTMLLLAPLLINKFGVGKATAYGIFIFLLTFILPFSSTNLGLLCLGMYFVGATSGFTDIAMNTLVTELEREDGVSIMSANHGFFSIGGFFGAGIGGFFLEKVSYPLNHLFIVIIIMLILNLIFVKFYFNVRAEEQEKMAFSPKNFLPLLGISLIGFFVMASEGAIVDWSALYLENVSMASISMLGLGYTAFSITMAIGRFLGDEISSRYGSKQLIVVGSLLASFGFGLVLLVTPVLAIIGFGLVGLGLSVIVPELFRMGGNTPGIESSQGISVIAGSGFIGFLLGPVILGFLANLSSLKLSFIALLCFTIGSLWLAIRLRR